MYQSGTKRKPKRGFGDCKALWGGDSRACMWGLRKGWDKEWTLRSFQESKWLQEKDLGRGRG